MTTGLLLRRAHGTSSCTLSNRPSRTRKGEARFGASRARRSADGADLSPDPDPRGPTTMGASDRSLPATPRVDPLVADALSALGTPERPNYAVGGLLAAMVKFAAAGHSIDMIVGNHDIELLEAPVVDELCRTVTTKWLM